MVRSGKSTRAARSSAWVAVLLLVCSGCADDGRLASVSGTITLNGKPLPNAHIQFEPKEIAEDGTGGISSYAHADKDGKYTLKTLDDSDGAVVGLHRVRITLPASGDDTSDEVDPAFKSPIPKRYRDGSLEFTVKPGGHSDADFDIQTTN